MTPHAWLFNNRGTLIHKSGETTTARRNVRRAAALLVGVAVHPAGGIPPRLPRLVAKLPTAAELAGVHLVPAGWVVSNAAPFFLGCACTKLTS